MDVGVSAIMAAIPSFSFGYQLGAADAVAPALRACTAADHLAGTCFPVNTDTPQWGLAVGQMCLGALIGSLLIGRLCDRLGRVKAVRLVNPVYMVGLAVTRLGNSLLWFAVGRLVIGVAVGGACVAVPVYLADLCAVKAVPQHLRGLIGSAHQMAIVCGYLVVQCLALFIGGVQWKWLYIVNEALVYLHTIILFIPHVLIDSRSSSNHHDDTTTITTTNTGNMSILQVMTCGAARKSLLMACSLHLVQQLSGINGVFSYAGDLFTGVWWVPVALAVLNVAMTVVSMSLMERLGRRPLLLTSVASCAVALLVATVAMLMNGAVVASVAVLVYVAGFAVGLGPIPWLMMGELFPKESVAAAVSMAVSVNWTMNFAVTAGFPAMAARLGVGKFVPFVAVLVVFFVVAWRELVETRGRPADYMT